MFCVLFLDFDFNCFDVFSLWFLNFVFLFVCLCLICVLNWFEFCLLFAYIWITYFLFWFTVFVIFSLNCWGFELGCLGYLLDVECFALFGVGIADFGFWWCSDFELFWVLGFVVGFRLLVFCWYFGLLCLCCRFDITWLVLTWLGLGVDFVLGMGVVVFWYFGFALTFVKLCWIGLVDLFCVFCYCEVLFQFDFVLVCLLVGVLILDELVVYFSCWFTW